MSVPENQQALRLLKQASHILVITHVSPDGDAIGSLLGMSLILQQLTDASVTLACDDVIPEKFLFLPGATDIINDLGLSRQPAFDLVVVLDCSDHERGGQVLEAARPGGTPLINIDHHITNTYYADANIVMVDAVATAEVLHRLLTEWGLLLTQDTALCLLTGLVTDTLCFRTANVTAAVMQVAASLMDAGADLSLVTSQTVNRKSYEAVQYWGRLLSTVTLDDRVVSVHSSVADRRAAGLALNGDASVVTFLITAWEADMAASFVEKDNGQVEISLRSKPGFDVSGTAFSLGGGGHPAAAGCTIDGPLDAAMERVLELLRTTRRQQAAEAIEPATF